MSKLWKSINILNKCSSSIPVLSQGPTSLSSDQEKADALTCISFFSQCFNHSVPPLKFIDYTYMNTCPDGYALLKRSLGW